MPPKLLMPTGSLLFVALLAVTSAPATPSLEGRWRLVENTYQGGRANLARHGPVLHLEIGPGAEGLAVRTWAGDDHARAQPWPAVINASGIVAIDVAEVTVDTSAGRIRARYRVPASTEDALTIDLVEEYELDPARDALVGTMTVRMYRDGQPRGGYVLHRRFERER